nr:hypothetical protein BSM_28830 [uncultured archaeon]CBH39891.1 hypothetical protein BSM_33700 [uncultured archaeon]
MAIKRKKKHGRVYLEEYKSVRINGKVKSIYLRSLGPENPVDQSPAPKPKILDDWNIGLLLERVLSLFCGNLHVSSISLESSMKSAAVNSG